MSNIRKITKNNRGTYHISMPQPVIKNLKWKDGQKVVVKQVGDKIVIEDWKEKKK